MLSKQIAHKIMKISGVKMQSILCCIATLSPLRSKKIHPRYWVYKLIGTPKGTRTPDSTVRGWRLNRLTIGAYLCSQFLICVSNNYINWTSRQFNSRCPCKLLCLNILYYNLCDVKIWINQISSWLHQLRQYYRPHKLN